MRRIFPLLAALLLAVPAFGTPANDDAAFGGAVAVSGETVFIGEPRSFSQPGRVHVFEQTADGTWETVAVLAADDGAIGDGFGDALAATTGAVLVGAPQAHDSRGAAYLFVRRDDGAWIQAARLAAPDAAEGDAFGTTVAFDGTHAYVGTPGANDRAGAVHVFAPAGDGWAHHTTLTASDAAEGHRFGSAMAVEGPRLAVGAPFHTQATGAVYLFEATGDGWAERLQLAGAEANHRFGMAVALNGSEVVVAAPFANELAGLVHIYDVDGEGAWSEIARFEPTGEEPARSFFGQALHFEGDNGWIGAPGAGGFAGILHHYHRRDGAWMHADEVAGDGVEPGDSFAGSFAIDGDLAVAGASRADYGEGMATILEREGNQWSAQTLVFAEAEPLPPIVGGEVSCTEGEAAAFGCGRVDLVAFVPNAVMEMNRGVRLNDVWGWTDAETGTEYALIGHMEGTAFLDLSDPTHPTYLGTLPRTEGSPGSTWRDMKVYGDHVFIVADGAGEHGMQIFDLTRLRDVQDGPVTFEADAHYDQIASAHNLVINEETATAYIVGSGGGGETCGGGLHMVDVSTPQRPTFAGCFGHEGTGRRGTGYSHDAQCVLYHGPDADYQGREICVGANETAISIADVTDRENPVAIATGAYPNSAYVHQGWLSDDHRYFFQNDELDELQGKVDRTRTLIWDLTDLDDPQLVKEHFGEASSTDHNLYVRGTLMYQTNNASGLRILDVSDPENPVEVGFFDTTPTGLNVAGFDGTWSSYPYFESGLIVVTSRREGVFILKKQEVDL